MEEALCIAPVRCKVEDRPVCVVCHLSLMPVPLPEQLVSAGSEFRTYLVISTPSEEDAHLKR